MKTVGQFTGALGASIIDYSKGCCSDSNSQKSAIPFWGFGSFLTWYSGDIIPDLQ
jgi:hypothetical protein